MRYVLRVSSTFACPLLIILLNIRAHLSRFIPVILGHETTRTRSSTGVNRTKKGRQVMARRTVASQHCKGHQISNYSRTKESNPSPANMMTMQSSSTQTDMRDSEIQTDPWWYRSEGMVLDIEKFYILDCPLPSSNHIYLPSTLLPTHYLYQTHTINTVT